MAGGGVMTFTYIAEGVIPGAEQKAQQTLCLAQEMGGGYFSDFTYFARPFTVSAPSEL